MTRPPPDVRAAATRVVRPPVKFGFALTNGFSMLAFSCFVEALRQMEDHGARCRTSFCDWVILGDAPTRSSCQVPVGPTAPWSAGEELDFLVVVGGRRDAQLERGGIELLQRIDSRRQTIVALDTATFLMARLGMFHDHTYCIHWFHYGEFVEEFPALKSSADVIFRVEDRFISCAGGTWAGDLAVHLLTALWGPEDAGRAVAFMGMERTRSATHFQSPFFQGAPVVKDVRIARAIQLIERRGSDPPSLQELSAVAGVSSRQLERLFVDALGLAPLQCAMVIRLRFGHWLLTNSARPLARVAADCGFTDQSHFTKCFRKQFGLTPMQARRAAAVVPAPSRRDSYALDAKSELHASGLAFGQPARRTSRDRLPAAASAKSG